MLTKKETIKLIAKIKVRRLDILICKILNVISPSFAKKYKIKLEKRLSSLHKEILKKI
jgi:hypothetical protein